MGEHEKNRYLADLVREWRNHRGMSQKDLADALGLHQSAVAKIETMERRVTYPLLLQIVEALDIPWDLLRPEEPEPQKKILEALESLTTATRFVMGAKMQIGNFREAATKARKTLESLMEEDEQAVQAARTVEKKLEDLHAEIVRNGLQFSYIRLQSIQHEITGQHLSD